MLIFNTIFEILTVPCGRSSFLKDFLSEHKNSEDYENDDKDSEGDECLGEALWG